MLCTVRGSARCYLVRHMCLYLVVMDRVDQPMPVALACCTIIIGGGNNFGMCGVRGRIVHEIEVVKDTIVCGILLCWVIGHVVPTQLRLMSASLDAPSAVI